MPRLKDGFKTVINIGGTNIFEMEVQPPGLEGGDAIETTTMRNVSRRTKAARQLIEMTNGSLTVAYDPASYSSLKSQINNNQELTVTFPDLSTLQFWGYLKNFIPNPLVEGEMPTAECEIVGTLSDNDCVEQDWVYTAAP